MRSSARPGQHQGNVVRLLGNTDPVIDGGGTAFVMRSSGRARFSCTSSMSLLAEFSEIVFWFGHAVAVCENALGRTWIKPCS